MIWYILFNIVYQITNGWCQCWVEWIVGVNKSLVLGKDVEKFGYTQKDEVAYRRHLSTFK